MDSEEDKSSVGKPLIFKTVDELDKAIRSYFRKCDPHASRRKVFTFNEKTKRNGERWEKYMTEQIPYTISGLARHLGTSRQTICNYRDRPEYFDSIARAKTMCEAYAEEYLFSGKTPTGAMFNLKNNYGWIDKTEVVNTKTDTEILDGLEELERQRAEAVRRAAEELEQEENEETGPEA